MPFRFVQEQANQDQKSNTQQSNRFRFVEEEKENPEFPSESNQESLLGNIGRQLLRSGARVEETILGAPRAFGEFMESLIPEKLLKKGAKKLGIEKPIESGLEFSRKYAPYKLFPKSQQVRDLNKFLFGAKIEPKNKWEEKADNAISDFAALALPFPGSQLKLLKPGLLAAGGNIASEVVGQIGGTEKEKTYAKLGTFLVGSMINPGSAKKLEKNLYDQARGARPNDAKVKTNELIKKTKDLEKQLSKGDPNASSKKKSVDLLKEIRSKVKNNEIDIEELEQFKRDINEARSGLYETFKTDKVGRKSAKRNLDAVSNVVDDTLKSYGRKNPEWESFYRPANEVHGAIAQSQRVRNKLVQVAKKYSHHAILPILGIGHMGGAAAIEGIAASAAVGAGIVGTGEIISKVMKSPTLRKRYMDLINSALKDDVVAIRENMDKLERELQEE